MPNSYIFHAEKDVALRKESVDRNYLLCKKSTRKVASLSARRAWIEIYVGVMVAAIAPVALRKESVDRNMDMEKIRKLKSSSLSARRAWIEIRLLLSSALGLSCRSPQGERG